VSGTGSGDLLAYRVVTGTDGARWRITVLDRAPEAHERGWWVEEDHDAEKILRSLLECMTTADGAVAIDEVGWQSYRDVPHVDPDDDMVSVTVQLDELEAEIDDFQAAEIASGWHSVMTWSDPGVAMYSVTSTGKVHSEEHRANLINYINTCIPGAEEADRAGDDPIVMESNVADLESLREWVEAFQITADADEEA
jgi:hypothetical protein